MCEVRSNGYRYYSVKLHRITVYRESNRIVLVYRQNTPYIDVTVSGFTSANLFKSQKPVVKIPRRKWKRKYPLGIAQLVTFGLARTSN